MPSIIQVYPNRVTITPQREPERCKWQKFYLGNGIWGTLKNVKQAENFKAVKNPFVLSKTSKRKLMDSINSMYILSKPRTIAMKTGKKIYNFRMSFITLTLPSKQVHADVEIKKLCINQFLQEMRFNYKMKNFVWKAELQGNGNIHFHLLLDRYIDYQALRRRWNRIINKLGYVDAYQNKMSAMSLLDYHNTRNVNGHCDFEASKKAFASGKASNWKNPNSVDVRSVYGKRELAIYLSKYITKKVSKKNEDNESVERQLAFGRSWSRSTTLATLKYRNKFEFKEVADVIKYLGTQKDKVLEIMGDYFRVFYFATENLSKSFQKFHKEYIFANARLYNYPLPVP